jgi:hypothetical protein
MEDGRQTNRRKTDPLRTTNRWRRDLIDGKGRQGRGGVILLVLWRWNTRVLTWRILP